MTSAIFGCNEKALPTAAVDAGEHAASASLPPEQAAKVLAKVGDRTITLGDYVAVLEHMGQFDRLRYQSPERRRELLNEMINVELLARESIAKGYDKDPVAEEQLRGILRDAMLAELHKEGPAPADIAESDVRAYFDSRKSDFHDPERRRASVIVLKDEASARDVLEAAKKTTTAAQWGDLVRTKSIDAQAKANVPADTAGDFGIVSPPGDTRGENPRVPDEVRVALFQIPNLGEVWPHVIAAKDGKFYLVRFAQKTEAHDRTYAEVEKTIRVKLAQDKMHAKESELLAQLRAKYPVQIDDAVIANVRVDTNGDAGADSTTDADAAKDGAK